MTTPPGWYPEPGHTGNDAPALERWWDGTEWTEYTRSAQDPASATAPLPGYPPYQPGDVVAGGAPAVRSRGRIAIAVVAAVVVVGAVVGGVVALTSNGSSNDTSATQPNPSASAPFGGGQSGAPSGGPGDQGQGGPGGGQSGAPSTAPSAVPSAEAGFLPDVLDGVSIPLPDGWSGGYDTSGKAVMVVGEYACPADATLSCARGGLNALPAKTAGLKATTAEAAAKEDISKAATEAYGTKAYGAITSHTQLKSEAVTVAGQKGYLVRWKVVTAKGDDGYVQSVVFPSPADSSKLVVLRFGFDVSSKAPTLSVMDTITKGVKETGSSSGTGV